MDAVSEVLVRRSRELDGLERMFGASVVAHVALVAAVVLVPASWLGMNDVVDEGPVMTISLGGPSAPSSGGLTAMGGRPIQTVPTEAKKAIEPVRPPAAAQPEMIEPLKNAPKKTESRVPEAKDPKSKTPTKGAEVRPGSSVADTQLRGQGFGLATPGFGDGAYLDVADFCCPEYLATMRDLIKKNWESRQQAEGTSLVKFTIQRNGTITNITLERSSGYTALDFMAQRALFLTRQLQPLPAAFTEPTLTVYLPFKYQR